MIYSLFLVLPFVFVAVDAANDWTKPCFDGVCSYDLPASANASGTVQLSGTSLSISDITTAADWMILGCDSNALAQNIRVVCQGDEATTGCNHLFQNTGPVGKLIRLPENCGRNPFARVASANLSEDQSIPSSIAAQLVRRDGVQPQVHSFEIDTQYSAIDPSMMGVVSISILGSTIPGANVSATPAPPLIHSRFARRGFFGSILNSISDLSNSVNINQTDTLPPINVNKDFPLFNGSVACSGGTLSVEADVDTATNALVSIGVVATGTIIPPSLSEFALFAGLTATINGTLNLAASATGTISSGTVTLFEVGIPGLDIPGILTVGPSFKVDALTTATLDVDVDLQVGLSYNINNAKLFFPPSSQLQSGGDFAPGDTPLAISVSPSVQSSGTISAHLIPTIDLGLDALGGIASATVFLDLDASASLDLSLNATTSVSATINADPAASSTTASDSPSSSSASSSITATPASTSSVGTPAKRNARSAFKRRDTNAIADHTKRGATVAPIDVNGCVNVGTSFDVNAGAQGSFFNIFNDSTQVTLFSKQFTLFNQCLGGAINTKRSVYSSQRRDLAPLSKRDSLTCPGSDIAGAVSVVNELVNAASILAL